MPKILPKRKDHDISVEAWKRDERGEIASDEGEGAKASPFYITSVDRCAAIVNACLELVRLGSPIFTLFRLKKWTCERWCGTQELKSIAFRMLQRSAIAVALWVNRNH